MAVQIVLVSVQNLGLFWCPEVNIFMKLQVWICTTGYRNCSKSEVSLYCFQLSHNVTCWLSRPTSNCLSIVLWLIKCFQLLPKMLWQCWLGVWQVAIVVCKTYHYSSLQKFCWRPLIDHWLTQIHLETAIKMVVHLRMVHDSLQTCYVKCCPVHQLSLTELTSLGWRGGLVVGRRICDLRVAGSRPGRDAAAQQP